MAEALDSSFTSQLKIAVVGDQAAYVTELISQFVVNAQLKNGERRISGPGNYAFMNVKVGDKVERVRVEILDCVLCEQFNTSRIMYYKGADAVVICFSLSSADSLDKVQSTWIPEIKTYCSKNTPFVMVGTKKSESAGDIHHGSFSSFSEFSPVVRNSLLSDSSAGGKAMRSSTASGIDGEARELGAVEYFEVDIGPSGTEETQQIFECAVSSYFNKKSSNSGHGSCCIQ